MERLGAATVPVEEAEHPIANTKTGRLATLDDLKLYLKIRCD